MKWAGIAAFASKQVGCGMRRAFGLARWHLARGNKAVFQDIYPAIRLHADFADSDRDAVLATLKRSDAIEKPIHDALASIPPGTSPDSYANWIAAVALLKHEQETTLQRAIYESRCFRFMLRVGRSQPFSRLFPIFVSFHQSCGRLDSEWTVVFNGLLEEPNDRIAFAQKVLFRFRELTASEETGIMVVEELKAIQVLAL